MGNKFYGANMAYELEVTAGTASTEGASAEVSSTPEGTSSSAEEAATECTASRRCSTAGVDVLVPVQFLGEVAV